MIKMPEKPLSLATAAGLPNDMWLASQSPRRLELLQMLGIKAHLFIPQTGEQAEALEAAQPNENPKDYVQRVTMLKLNTAVQKLNEQNQQGLVLAADTTVALGHDILGKPATPNQAFTMLEALSNQQHQVFTAVAVANLGNATQKMIVHTSTVSFATIPEPFMKHYIESGQPFDKAGGYGIQGAISQFIFNINGSHSGIMGLPLHETSKLIRTMSE